MKVLLTNNRGMLGYMAQNVLSKDKKIELYTLPHFWRYPKFDPKWSNLQYDYIFNTIGKIKSSIKEGDSESEYQAILANSLLPHEIAKNNPNSILINPATDAVFAGNRKEPLENLENDEHNPTDIYGKTKSLGESSAPNVINLRTSFIGPEIDTKKSLLEKILAKPKYSIIDGYFQEIWSGITTLAYCKIVKAIILNKIECPNKLHLQVNEPINKADLLRLIAQHFKRTDLVIINKKSKYLNRKLGSLYPGLNRELWELAGYKLVDIGQKTGLPSIRQLVQEFSLYE